MRNILTFTAISAIALSTSSPAFAATVLFDIKGPDAISFTVDQSPSPEVFFKFFRLYNVPITVNGTTYNSQVNVGLGGDIGLLGFQFKGFDPLFTGDLATPTFLPGDYPLLSILKMGPDGKPEPGIAEYSLRISEVAAVPEPATWALMLLGMAGVGYSMRRKTKQTLRVRYT